MRIIFLVQLLVTGIKRKFHRLSKMIIWQEKSEIFETAQRLVKKYKQSQQFRYVLVKRPQIRERTRKLQVDLSSEKFEIRGFT